MPRHGGQAALIPQPHSSQPQPASPRSCRWAGYGSRGRAAPRGRPAASRDCPQSGRARADCGGRDGRWEGWEAEQIGHVKWRLASGQAGVKPASLHRWPVSRGKPHTARRHPQLSVGNAEGCKLRGMPQQLASPQLVLGPCQLAHDFGARLPQLAIRHLQGRLPSQTKEASSARSINSKDSERPGCRSSPSTPAGRAAEWRNDGASCTARAYQQPQDMCQTGMRQPQPARAPPATTGRSVGKSAPAPSPAQHSQGAHQQNIRVGPLGVRQPVQALLHRCVEVCTKQGAGEYRRWAAQHGAVTQAPRHLQQQQQP